MQTCKNREIAQVTSRKNITTDAALKIINLSLK